MVLAMVLSSLGACRHASGPEEGRPSAGGELVASIRSEPGNYNRYFEATAAADLIALLTHARLVRVNRVTDDVEGALAESWEESADRSVLTLRLRRNVVFSDGEPFTSADVLFSFDVAYDAPGSRIGHGLMVAGQRLVLSAADDHTVSVRFPRPFAPGVRILNSLPILPRHRLEDAWRAGTIESAWAAGTPPASIAGLGPFVLAEHTAGQRLLFTRNPHYWRTAADGAPLPYLDRLRVDIVPEQNAEALRLEAGDTDLMSNADIRAEDYARFKRLADQDRLRLIDGGVGLDPNVLWFNLAPARGTDTKPWLRTREFRQALSFGVDRQAIVNAVHLGAAVPIYGPVTPRNTTWHSPDVPVYPHDPAKARQLLAGIGLTDADGDGILEDSGGRPVRFSVLLQQGVTSRERTVAILQEQFRRLGIRLDVVPVDNAGLGRHWRMGDYESIFHSLQASSTDPGMNLDFWLSSGASHLWHPGQTAPATGWERRIDDLMHRQVATYDLAERQRLFLEVQRIFGEELPALYFVAPKVTLALSPRVANATPAPQIPELLWAAETLAVSPGARSR